MVDTDKIFLTLQNLSLFQKSGKSLLEQMAAQSQLIKAGKGQVLFTHGSDATKFYVVIKGWVKLYRETLDGTQAVVDILPPGHLFAETSLFEDGLYPYSAEATEPAEVLAVPIHFIKSEIENNPQFALAMISSMAHYKRQQDRELEHRTIQNASQRIGCFLLRLIDQQATGAVTIHLPYDKTLVASRLGMQPETFSRALLKLRSETNMKVKGATIELENVNDLKTYACSACSSNFPCKDLVNSH